MMFKNSIRLLIANFSTVWKLILYYIIVVGIIVGLTVPFWGVINSELNAYGTLTEIGELFTTFNVSVNLFSFLTELAVIVNSLVNSILALFVTNTWIAIYLFVLLFYIAPVLFGLADLPAGQTLFGYMSSLTKYGFVGSYVRMLKRSFRFQLFKNLIFLLFNVGAVVIFIMALRLTTIGGIMIFFVPVILIASIIILIAIKRTLFSGWMPAIVVYDCNMFVAFGKGMKAVFKRLFRVFSTALMITIIAVAIGYLFGTFAIFVIIPLSVMLFYVFEMVMFYTSQGMKFYVDLDTIVSSKLLEECDSFKSVKEII